MNTVFRKQRHEVDFCVVGAGMSGYAAALAAANYGAKVAIMHDRPVVGGNASSEVRMHICGADGHNSFKNLRETGFVEELRLKNLYRNPEGSYGLWDTILYEELRYHPNITLILNCSCLDAETRDGSIVSVTGWQIQSETYHEIRARWFADCSGDGILAPLTGAEFRIGREGRGEFNEPNAPERADRRTMGNTLMFSVRDCGKPVPFVAPSWAEKYPSCDDLPYGLKGHEGGHFDGQVGHWWVELGGEDDTILENEELRDRLLRVVYGVWDHYKNHCAVKDKYANFTLDWLAFLPAKRESRRFVGEYMLSQNDLAEGKLYEDTVAYGGWAMDDHDPAGFRACRSGRHSTIFHKCQPGYGIPWRALYSRNIPNLLFAGRNASCTHMAMSSIRVMATCMVMGQAIGTGVGLLKQNGWSTPAQLAAEMRNFQQQLLRDDCYLPGVAMVLPDFARQAKLSAEGGRNGTDPDAVRDGWSRQIGEATHAWETGPGGCLTYQMNQPAQVEEIFLALDSVMEDDITLSWCSANLRNLRFPARLPKEYAVEVECEGTWQTLFETTENYARHRRLKVGKQITGARLTIRSLWGESAPFTRVYSFCLL